MRRLTLALDTLVRLRQSAGAADVDVAAAATLADLAGVDAVRLGVEEDAGSGSMRDLQDARRSARRLELRMPATPSLLKIALEARPDRVLLADSGRTGALPLDLTGRGSPIGGVVRSLAEAGIEAWARVAPSLDAVKAAHGEGTVGVEFDTHAVAAAVGVDWSSALEPLGDAVRLAAKLRMGVGVAGGLGYASVRDVLDAAPAVERVAVGRAAIARATLVGIDRAVRDLRALLG